MSQEQPKTQSQELVPLTPEQLDQVSSFFQERLIGQPEVIQTLTNVLYKQNALLKHMLEQDQGAAYSNSIPNDPTVILLMGGSWGKSLAARLIPMALEQLELGYGALTVLTPLPQDPEGSLNLDPHALTVPFATVVIENIESAQAINARFVANLARLLDTGQIRLIDPAEKTFHAVPLGLSTFILTSSVADQEIRQALNPETRLGFLVPSDEQAIEATAVLEKVRKICLQSLDLLPHQLLHELDETVVLRPLSEKDLKQIFDLEIAQYQKQMFPNRTLAIAFKGTAKARLFQEAKEGLGIYGAHTLRRVLQRHIDPLVYRAYNKETLTETNLEEHRIVVRVENDSIQVQLEQKSS